MLESVDRAIEAIHAQVAASGGFYTREQRANLRGELIILLGILRCHWGLSNTTVNVLDSLWRDPRSRPVGLLHYVLSQEILYCHFPLTTHSPVVGRLISANPGLNFNPGFSISLFKSLFELIFPIFCRVSSNHILDKKNQTEFSVQSFPIY